MSSWFVVFSSLFPYPPIWNVTTVNCMKSVKFNTQWLKTKVAVIGLHDMSQKTIQPTSCPRWTLDSIFNSFTEVAVLCVNRAAEPKQNNTFKLRSKRPTCAFNLDTPSTPRAFLFTFTQLLPCNTFFFSLKLKCTLCLVVVISLVYV